MDLDLLAEALAPVLPAAGAPSGPAGAAPAYAALAGVVRSLILDGRLLPGDVLPAERRLAVRLGASRSTVTAALDQLRAEGLLMSRQGSGTVVATGLAPAERPDELFDERPDVRVDERPDGHPDERLDGRTADRLADRPAHDGAADIDLTVAAPSAPALLGPLAVEAAARLPPLLAGPGLHPFGLPELRAGIARRFTDRGLPTRPDQVLVTQGALHAWDLLLHAFARPGAVVGLEVPTYAGCTDAARAHHVRLTPIGVDERGWSLPRHAPEPALALVTPDFQNPTGAHASAGQRRGLLRALPHTRVVVDETCSELALDDDLAACRPMAAYGADVVTVGSLSKLVWPGLRIGWVRAEPGVVRRLAAARGAQDIAAPVLDQLLAARVLERVDDVRRERVLSLRARRDHLLALLAGVGWPAARPGGGCVLWADLGEGASSTRLAATARAHRVRVVPGPRFGFGGTHDRYLRLPYTRPEPVLTEAVARLRAAAADPRHPPADAPRWTA